jgi:glycosyltransferase involved in cell wall biosynthesis
MLTPYLPYPPSSGGHIRSFNLIKNLSKNHKIVLVSLVKSDEEKQYSKYLEQFCEKIYVCKRPKSPWTLKNIVTSILGIYPLLIVRNYSNEAHEVISNLLKKDTFDLIHAETFYIMPHIPKTTIPILLVEQTIEYLVYEKFVNSLKYFFFKILLLDVLKLKYWEKEYWKKADLVATVSDSDRDIIRNLIPDTEVVIIPNAAGEDLMNVYTPTKKIDKPVFLFQGNFSWLQNVEAAEILAKTIFPEIKKAIPNAKCYIAGQNCKNKIEYLAQYGATIIDIASDDIEKVKEVYKESSVFIAPIEGPGGTRLKILGAMAAGIPVISSTIGITGLDVTDGKDVLIASNTQEYVEKSKQILKDKKLYENIRTNARKLIEAKYNWGEVAHYLEDIYKSLKNKKYENSH